MGIRTTFVSTLIMVLTFVTGLTTAAQASTQKFVYVYNSQGQLLAPLNPAHQCPDPARGNGPATACQGVAVDDNGDYRLRMASVDLSANENLIFVANRYRFIATGSRPGINQDIYIIVA